jgi:hypothetical protein
MRWVLPFAVLLLAATLPSPAEAEEATGSIEGVVKDQAAGMPLAGVSVTVAGEGVTKTVTTGKDGRYALKGLSPGRYSALFVFGKTRYKRTDLLVTEGAGASVNVKIDVTRSAEVVKVKEKAPESKAAPPKPAGKYLATPPPYSDEAVDSDIWSRAWLLLDVDVTGKVTAVTFLKKAGHGLDEIAEQEAMKYKFKPALDDDGKPIASRIAVMMEWPSWWYVHTLVSTGQPPCAGSGPLNLGSLHPVYRDCSTVELPEGVTLMEPADPPVQFMLLQ